ncbi:serine/threonine-protein kinase HAL4/sat4 [Entophlyctis sp. JEL0112]|nr:serine/threonine-protein kinase HAL4/sat4 [Entophlyctis sp. JEL0112]
MAIPAARLGIGSDCSRDERRDGAQSADPAAAPALSTPVFLVDAPEQREGVCLPARPLGPRLPPPLPDPWLSPGDADPATDGTPSAESFGDSLHPTLLPAGPTSGGTGFTLMITCPSSENVLEGSDLGTGDDQRQDTSSLFDESIKIQRDERKQSTFAGIVSGSKLYNFRTIAAARGSTSKPLGSSANISDDESSTKKQLPHGTKERQKSSKKNLNGASDDLEDGNSGDTEEIKPNNSLPKKLKESEGYCEIVHKSVSDLASLQRSDQEDGKCFENMEPCNILQQATVGSPHSSLSNVDIRSNSVAEVNPSHSQEPESDNKVSVFPRSPGRPRSAPTGSKVKRMQFNPENILSTVTSTSSISPTDTTSKRFISRMFHLDDAHNVTRPHASDSSDASNHSEDHRWYNIFHHHASSEKHEHHDSNGEGEHPHWHHIARRQESIFAKYFLSRLHSGEHIKEGCGSPESPVDGDSPTLTPRASPQSPRMHDGSSSASGHTSEEASEMSQEDASGKHSSIFKGIHIGVRPKRGSSASAKRSASADTHHADDGAATAPHGSENRLFKNLMTPKFSDTHKSPDQSDQEDASSPLQRSAKKLNVSTFARKKNSRTSSSPSQPSPVHSPLSLFDKYGKIDEVLGKGASATVRLAHKHDTSDHEVYYAIKKFRKRHKKESEKDYIKKVIGEFCISSSLHHENVIETLDLIQDERREWCVVMEYMSGGDLYARIHDGLDDQDEINCYFKQLMNGLAYIHSMGVAHRDLKPENLILDTECRILKIADFGVAEVFKTAFEVSSRKSKGVCGSEPYIAPEEWLEDAEYYAAKVDVWACGIIYYALLKNSVPWHIAKLADARYAEYLKKRNPQYDSGYIPFDRLPSGARHLTYQILEPEPSKRWTTQNILEDPWLISVECCSLGGQNAKPMVHKHQIHHV